MLFKHLENEELVLFSEEIKQGIENQQYKVQSQLELNKTNRQLRYAISLANSDQY